MSLIAVGGYSSSGKDTVGRILVEEYGFRRVAFADKVREALLILDPYICDDMFCREGAEWVRLSSYVGLRGWDKAKEHPEVRRLQQVFATEVVRDLIDKDVWARLALDPTHPDEQIVVTDLRFKSEAEAVWRRDGEVWRVRRKGYDEPPWNHSSETELDTFEADREVYNDGTREDLKQTVDRMMEEWSEDRRSG